MKIKYLLCGSFPSAAPRYPEAPRLSQYLPVLESCLDWLKGLECPTEPPRRVGLRLLRALLGHEEL